MAKILLVDDDKLMRGLQAQVLVAEGHTVMQACDGNEALRRAQAEPFDLVITDIVMPDKEGIEVIIRLRKMNPSAKIVAMSGGGHIEARRYLAIAAALGAVVTLQKPFAQQELLDAVSAALGP